MFERPRKMPQSPKWGNGRKEFMRTLRAPVNKPQCSAADIIPSMDFSSEREKEMVRNVYANLGKQSLSMCYRNSKGEETIRRVTPLVIALSNGYWGFISICHLRDDIRWFRFSRIVSVDPVPLIHEVDPVESILRFMNTPVQVQTSIWSALEILDPTLCEKLHVHKKLLKSSPLPISK